MRPEKKQEENYGTRMFCDRFDKPRLVVYVVGADELERQFKELKKLVEETILPYYS